MLDHHHQNCLSVYRLDWLKTVRLSNGEIPDNHYPSPRDLSSNNTHYWVLDNPNEGNLNLQADQGCLLMHYFVSKTEDSWQLQHQCPRIPLHPQQYPQLGMLKQCRPVVTSHCDMPDEYHQMSPPVTSLIQTVQARIFPSHSSPYHLGG